MFFFCWKWFRFVLNVIFIVVIACGLAAVYRFSVNDVQTATVSKLVIPTVHAIQTNVEAYHAIHDGTWPDTAMVTEFSAGAGTYYVGVLDTSNNIITLVVNATDKLQDIVTAHGGTLIMTATTDGEKITKWELGGSLAAGVGLQ